MIYVKDRQFVADRLLTAKQFNLRGMKL
jgi:hypothetical protein